MYPMNPMYNSSIRTKYNLVIDNDDDSYIYVNTKIILHS